MEFSISHEILSIQKFSFGHMTISLEENDETAILNGDKLDYSFLNGFCLQHQLTEGIESAEKDVQP